MRRGFVLLLVVFCSLAGLPRASACTRPYESPERVLTRAGYIAEVEVLSVTPIEGEKRGERARAEVRVRRELRGRLPMREFTLLGGPFDSCAPWNAYLSFTPGERLFLFLEEAVPVETGSIRIYRAPRVYRGTGEAVEGMLDRVHGSWSRRIEILAELAPEAMAEARELSTTLRSDGAFAPGSLTGQPLPVLLALRELLLDPRNPLPRPARKVVPLTESSPFTREPVREGPEEYLASFGELGLPRELQDALQAETPAARKEAGAFCRAALRVYLIEDLFVPEADADRFLSEVTDRSLLDVSGYSYWLKLADSAPRSARAVLSLMKVADPMPDWLVKSGGLAGTEHRALLGTWLEKNAAASTVTWSHLRAYFSLRLREARPAVLRALAEERIPHRLDDYLGYFLALSDPKGGQAVVRAAERMLPAEEGDEPPSWLTDLIRKATNAGVPAAPILRQLNALRKQ